jgi:adenylosuccinate lyase
MIRFLTYFFLLTTISFAHAKNSAEDLQKNKDRILVNLNARITRLEETKKCIEAAKTDDELKKCHKGMRDERRRRHEPVRAEDDDYENPPMTTEEKSK